MGARIMAANRLASNSKRWYEVFLKNNSGTGNKQWLIVNMNDASIEFGVVEQMPGIVNYEELSETLLANGYWVSNSYPSLEVCISFEILTFDQFSEHHLDRIFVMQVILTRSRHYFCSSKCMCKVTKWCFIFHTY